MNKIYGVATEFKCPVSGEPLTVAEIQNPLYNPVTGAELKTTGERESAIGWYKQRQEFAMTASEIQAAITKAITKNVRHQGSLIAETLSGREFTFRMNDTGAIGVYLTDEYGEEEEYCFRLEIVED